MTGKKRTTSTTNAPDSKPDWDFSLLRQPIEVGVPPGAMQVVKGIQSGNREVRELLLYECDIIYECRVCRNLFRGLTNLIAHKRVYCTATYQEARMKMMESFLETETVVVEPRSPPEDEQVGDDGGQDMECGEGDEHGANENDNKSDECDQNSNINLGNGEMDVPSSQSEPKANGISASVFYKKIADMVEKEKSAGPMSSVILQPIPGNKNAMFQSFKEDNKKESEDEEENASDDESQSVKPLSPPARVKTRSSTSCDEPPVAVVEPKEAKGHLRMNLRQRNNEHIEQSTLLKLSRNGDCDVKSMRCLKCETKFSSLKTLNFHMVSQHFEKRTVYPCLFCDKSFTYFSGTVRHVERSHNKSKEQMVKIKATIKKRAFTKTADFGWDGKRSTRSVSGNTKGKVMGSWKENGKVCLEDRLPRQKSGANAYSLSTDFTILKCKNCDSVFHKQESLDRHSSFCIEVKTSKQDDDGSSSNSSRSTSKSKRTIKVKTPESDFEASANVPLPRRVENDEQIIPENTEKEKEVSKSRQVVKRSAEISEQNLKKKKVPTATLR